MFFVVRAIHQGDGALARQCPQGTKLPGVLLQLGAIALCKPAPTRRIVAKPLAQRGTERQLLVSLVERQSFFFDAARPQPVNQDTCAIVWRWRLVGALDEHMARRDS